MEDATIQNHNKKQMDMLSGLVYFLLAIGLTMWLAMSDSSFTYAIQNLLADSKGMYPVKAAFLLQFFIVAAALYPAYWIGNKLLQKKAVSASKSGDHSFHEASKKEYSITYYAVIATVTFDDAVMRIKSGLVTKVFPLSRFKYFYSIKKKSYTTLYLAYLDEAGELKNIPMNAAGADPNMEAFLSELQQRFPGKSLQQLKQSEALKTIGAMNPMKLAIIILVIVVAVIAFFVMSALGI